ncbi:hypothetical protein H2248_006939 [Termitomyces sp. 'cryptogamus']|nr:hypothetical protein H2248_006939 [Termitomyces sp. 'cryptogamus']
MPSQVLWNFHQHVPLTPLGSQTEQSHNFAHCHATGAVSSPQSPQTTPQPLASQDTQSLDNNALSLDKNHNFFEGLRLPLAEKETAAIGEATSLVKNHDVPIEKDTTPPKEEKSAAHSLLEDIHIASDKEINTPPGPKYQHAPSGTLSNTSSNPFISNPDVKTDVLNHRASPLTPSILSTPQLELQALPTEDLQSPAQKILVSDGCPINITLRECQEEFVHIENKFIDLACLVKQLVTQVKKWFYSRLRASRNKNDWNLYQP